MNLYILPVQRVLLEYVLKLGDMIFFPGDVSNEAIEYSNLLDDEKEKLRLIVEHNRSFFTEQLTGLPFLLLSSKYDIIEINNDITIFEKILNDANRRFDYIRILECPFNRPEYTIMTIDTPLPPCMPFPRALTGFPVSSTAKVMYCRMLDAMLSKGQEDENGILFVCFPVTAIAAVLSRSPMTVKRSLNELETAGLIMRVRQGVGEPNRIYVLIPGKEDAALA